MRVPPETISGSPQWHLPAAMLLLAFVVLVAGFFSGFDGRAIATQSNRITKLQVVVTKHAIEAGALLSKDDLTLDVRPIESLPEDVLTITAPAIGLKAAVHIHEGTALTPQFLIVPGVEVAPTAAAKPEAAEPEIEVIKPALPVEAPKPPAHEIAVETPKELPKVEVTKLAVQPVEVKVPEPVEEAKPPPAKVETAAAVSAIAPPAAKAPEAVAPPAPQRQRRKFSSYAWVSGAGVTFGVDKAGKIQVVDPSGMSAPLDKDVQSEE